MATATSPWPPDYARTFTWRINTLKVLQDDPAALAGARAHYRDCPADFIDDWIDTYDPRHAGSDQPTSMPFRLFKRQRDLVQFLDACRTNQAPGLIEKCRDMGATYTCCGYSVWAWLFLEGSATGWGSRKEDLVDRIGDPKSVFWKIRDMVSKLPPIWLPRGFLPRDHATYMKMINPENGATITGEGGDNIGRGGRTSMYFKDESAHYAHPELVEAALADNTNVQIDISSVNGPGNVFHRRREAGIDWEPGRDMSRVRTNVFVMDWSDHPGKTQAWYDQRKAKAEADGLMHVHAQEIDRNYFAAVTGTVIPMEWIRAAIDADKVLGITTTGMAGAALDVADNDGRGDRNALAVRKGPRVEVAEEWAGTTDTGESTRRAIELTQPFGSLAIQYDCIGVGSGVKSEANRLAAAAAEQGTKMLVRFVSWNAGDGPQNPTENVIPGDDQSPLNEDFYGNLKAQGWWELRRRFERTWRWVTQGIPCDPDDIIVLPSTLPRLMQIVKELAQPRKKLGARMKMIIDKTPEGTRSPNIGDAIMMAFWPIEEWEPPLAIVGHYGEGD